MTSTERLRNIRAILKAIEKGYCKGNIIEYIMDLYDTTMQAATDIISLDCNTIEQLLENEYTSDDHLVEEMERLKLTRHVIAYVIDSDDKCVPDKQYQIDIDHGYNKMIAHDGRYNTINTVTFVSRYLVYDNKITSKLISGHPRDSHCYYSPSTPDYLIRNNNNQRTDAICEKIELSYHCSKYYYITDVSNNITDNNYFQLNHEYAIWSLSNYTLDSNYLTFYSRIHTIVETTDAKNNKKKTLSESYTPGDTLKIPLVNNLIMETPLGTVSVREAKVVTDWKQVNDWTPEDLEKVRDMN